jgi:multidrug efflux pump subunit AcrB
MLGQGMSLEEAVVEAGVVRFRPMLLTAAAVVAGSFVMPFDPSSRGLAISLMTGEVAATFLSRLAVPVVYYLIARRGWTRGLSGQRPLESRGIETLVGSAA